MFGGRVSGGEAGQFRPFDKIAENDNNLRAATDHGRPVPHTASLYKVALFSGNSESPVAMVLRCRH